MHPLWILPSLTVALATTFVEQPFPDTVQEAPIIARGKIGMRYADWSVGTDGQKRIYTYTELRVDEVLKGRVSGQNLVMRELGGEKDGVGMQVAGSAEFERGEDVVVFLQNPNKDGTHTVQGMMMGKYNVRQDANGQEFIEGAGLSSLGHPAIRGKEHLIHPEESQSATGASKYSLQALRDLIRDQSQGADARVQNPVISGQNPPSPSPTLVPPSEEPGAPTAAPQLQPGTPETSASDWAMVAWVGAGLAGIALLAWLLLRRRK
jgi:LPXTG-motif cell wall-anchored protein